MINHRNHALAVQVPVLHTYFVAFDATSVNPESESHDDAIVVCLTCQAEVEHVSATQNKDGSYTVKWDHRFFPKEN